MKPTRNTQRNDGRDGPLKIFLQPLEGRRLTCVGMFERYGIYPGDYSKTKVAALLSSITDSNRKPLAYHVWIRDITEFQKIDLQRGDTVQFIATVKMYQKGYHGDDINLRLIKPPRIDYGLDNIRIVKQIPVKK